MAEDVPPVPARPSWLPSLPAHPFYGSWGGASTGIGPTPVEQSSAKGQAGQRRRYLMIQVEPGRLDGVMDALRSMEGVVDACRALDPYDVVAIVEAGERAALSSMVSRVLELAGVRSASAATTCDLSVEKEER